MKKTSLLLTILASQIAVFAQTSGNPDNSQFLLAPASVAASPEKTTQANPSTLEVSAYLGNVFAFNAYAGAIPVGPFSHKLSTPGAYTALPTPTPSGQFAFAGAWANGKWYASRYPDNHLVTVDTTSGAWTSVGAMTVASGETWTGLSYDMVNGVMYGTSSSASQTTVYTVNLTTGASTVVGVATGASLICLAADNAGQLFSVDITGDNFGSVNKTTGAWTSIGPIGFNASYAQDMEFDHSNNTCFFAAYNVTASAAELRTVNVTTGATTLIGAYPAMSEIVGFAIPVSQSGILSHDRSIRNLNSYPNPFIEKTNITFSLSQYENVTLEVFDIYGKKVATLLDGRASAGSHTVTLNAAGLPSGVYSCRLTTSTGISTNKLILAD